MKRIFIVLTLLATVFGATGVALADGGHTTISTKTPTATSTPTPTHHDGVIEMDTDTVLSGTTSVVHWRYEGGSWVITIKSKTPQRVTVSDSTAIAEALSEGKGAKSKTIKGGRHTFNVGKGKTTIRFAGTEHEGMSAVTLTANNGDNIGVLRTDKFEPTKPAVQYSTAQALVGLAVVLTAFSIYRWVKRNQNKKEMEVERIL